MRRSSRRRVQNSVVGGGRPSSGEPRRLSATETGKFLGHGEKGAGEVERARAWRPESLPAGRPARLDGSPALAVCRSLPFPSVGHFTEAAPKLVF